MIRLNEQCYIYPHGLSVVGLNHGLQTVAFDFFADTGRFVAERYIFTKQRILLLTINTLKADLHY